MTRSQVEYVLTLAKLKNFGKAAEACFVTQSTLSAMIAKFEEQSGVVLFNRKTRPITITPKGDRILKSLKSIAREYQILDELINEIKGFEVGNVSIACIPTVAPYLYPLILNQLSNEYAGVNFTIHEFTTERIVEEIIAGTIDIGIVSIPLENKELVEYELYDEDFLIYDCGNENKDSTYRISDIDLERLWLMEEGHCLRNQVGKICELRQQKKINGNLTYSCGTIFTLIEMVKMNNGITLLPRLALSNNSHLDSNRIHSFSEMVPTRKIGLITHKNYIRKRILSSLTNTIKQAVDSYLTNPQDVGRMYKPF